MGLLEDLLGGMASGAGTGMRPGNAASAGGNPLIDIVLNMLTQGAQGGGGSGGLGGLGNVLSGLQPGGGASGQATGQGGGLGGLGGAMAAIGGIGGLIAMFQRAGLGDAIQSWIGAGQNQPVSADDLTRVFGHDTIGGIANQLGVSHGEAAGQLSQVLPQIIDALTPHGQVPQGGLGGPDAMMSVLQGMLGGRR